MGEGCLPLRAAYCALLLATAHTGYTGLCAEDEGSSLGALPEVAAAAQQTSVREVQLTPELLEAVLHRRAGEGESEVGVAARGRPAHLGPGRGAC